MDNSRDDVPESSSRAPVAPEPSPGTKPSSRARKQLAHPAAKTPPAKAAVGRRRKAAVSRTRGASAPSAAPPPEPNLFKAFEALVHFLGVPKTKLSALQALPCPAGDLTAEYLASAAACLDLDYFPQSASFSRIHASSFPLLLIPSDPTQEALVLLERKPDRVRGTASLEEQPREIFLSNLPKGRYVFFRPFFRYDARVSERVGLNPTESQSPDDKRSSLSWFLAPLRGNAGLLGLAVLAGFFVNLATIASSIFVMAVYDRVIPNRALESLMALLIGMGVVMGFDFLLKSLRVYMLDVGSRRFDLAVGGRVFGQVLDVRARDRPASSGALANLAREFDGVRDFFTSATLIALVDVPFVGLYLAIIWIIAGKVVWVPLIFLGLLLGLNILLQFPLRRLVAQSFQHNAQKSAFMHEVAVGVDTIKLANAQNWARQRYEDFLQSGSMVARRLGKWTQFSSHWTALTMSAVTVGTVSYGALGVLEGSLTTGAVIAATLLAGRAVGPLTQIPNLMTKWSHVRSALAAVSRLMRAPSETRRGLVFLAKLEGVLEVDQIGFAYPSSPGELGSGGGVAAPVLSNISFRMEAGEHIGVFGRVGSGKSTLLSLIANLWTPDSGMIRLDHIDNRQLDPACLRRWVHLQEQDTKLFYGTLRDNILLGTNWMSDEEVLKYVQIAGLDAFLKTHPLGLGAPVGERGQLLSGGQRQAVALARSLARHPSLLLMDEPTAAMDLASEKELARRLKAHCQRLHIGLLVVTHRTSLLPLFDRLLVLEGGRLRLDGHTDSILRKMNDRERKDVTT